MNCARCDYRADNLTEHAFDTGHRLCIVCQRRSLTEFERQTCPTCVGAVRADLADLVAAYALLEPDGLVGLTLTGDGTMQRHAHRYELDGGIRDEWPTDPLPVVAALASWEDFWRADYGDPTGPKATLTGVVDYLTRNLDTGHRAAQTHPAFDEFAHEVHRLRGAVQFAAGLAEVPVEAPAQCFDCGHDLHRTYATAVIPEAKRRNRARRAAAAVLTVTVRQRDAEATYGVPAGRLTDWPIGRARRHAREALLGTAGEGLEDTWTCTWCRREYTQTEYFIGLRVAGSMWVPLTLAATVAHRSVWTVRSWVRRLQVTSACDLDGTVVVWWPDVSDRAFRHVDDAPSRASA